MGEGSLTLVPKPLFYHPLKELVHGARGLTPPADGHRCLAVWEKRGEDVKLPPETQAAVSELAQELGCSEAELVARMTAFVVQLRALIWLRGPMGGREGA
jgi:hypothetical protein